MRVGRVFAAVIAVLTVAACSQTVGGTAERARPRMPDGERNYGVVDYRCGLLTSEEIQRLLDADYIVQSFTGAVCQYVLTLKTGSGDAVFSWFDAGSLDRERAIAVERGSRITDGDAARYPAFVAQRPDNANACAATAGVTPGVLTWWVQFRSGGGDPCDAAEKLLTATLSADL